MSKDTPPRNFNYDDDETRQTEIERVFDDFRDNPENLPKEYQNLSTMTQKLAEKIAAERLSKFINNATKGKGPRR